MRKILTIVFIAITSLTQAQGLPAESVNGFSFSLGTKFTIKLTPTDSVNFNYSIISIEPFQKTVDISDNDHLFEKQGDDNTIVFYFCPGTYGKMPGNVSFMPILLLMKNYSKYNLSYTSEVQRVENGEYEPTSNIGTSPNVKSIEMWPYIIHSLTLKEFRLYKES